MKPLLICLITIFLNKNTKKVLRKFHETLHVPPYSNLVYLFTQHIHQWLIVFNDRKPKNNHKFPAQYVPILLCFAIKCTKIIVGLAYSSIYSSVTSGSKSGLKIQRNTRFLIEKRGSALFPSSHNFHQKIYPDEALKYWSRCRCVIDNISRHFSIFFPQFHFDPRS